MFCRRAISHGAHICAHIPWMLTQGLTVELCRDLRDARGLLSARQDDLDRARQRSVAAEGKYKELLSLADRHKKYGDSAADAASGHGEKYEVCFSFCSLVIASQTYEGKEAYFLSRRVVCNACLSLCKHALINKITDCIQVGIWPCSLSVLFITTVSLRAHCKLS